MIVLWPYEWKVTGLNLDRHELTFIFYKSSFGGNVKRQRKTLCKEQPRGAGKIVSNPYVIIIE